MARISSLIRNELGQKQCRDCTAWYDISQFKEHSRSLDGLYYYCRDCNAFRNRDWHRNDRANASPERLQFLRDVSTIKQRNRIARMKNEAYAKLGEVCAMCGFDDRRALQVDHVNSDGGVERDNKGRRSVVSNTLYRRILQDTEGRYQILCANCNWIKRHTNNECPPRREVTLKLH